MLTRNNVVQMHKNIVGISRYLLTKGRSNLVKQKHAVLKPNGRTVKVKYLVTRQYPTLNLNTADEAGKWLYDDNPT